MPATRRFRPPTRPLQYEDGDHSVKPLGDGTVATGHPPTPAATDSEVDNKPSSTVTWPESPEGWLSHMLG